MDPAVLAQSAICGHSTGFKAIRAEWKSRIGGIPVMLVKGCLRRQDACANFFQLVKNQNRSQELREFGSYRIKGRPNPKAQYSKPPTLQHSDPASSQKFVTR